MTQGSTPTETPVDTRPWRKRHPVLSRTILYTLGLGLGVLLVVLWNDRKAEDDATAQEAIQKQIDGLGLVLAADPTGDRLLALLDEKFAADDLPVHARQRSLRWRAMGWRRKAETAETDAARRAAHEAADVAYATALALELPAAERFALRLERAEALLVRKDLAGAREALPELAATPGVTAALMRQFVLAQLMRLEGAGPQACALLRSTLKGVRGPLPTEPDAYIGGREWTAAQIAIELAAFVTSQDGRPSDADLWQHLCALAPSDYEAHKSAALGLLSLGSEDAALQSWRTARRLDPRLAGIEAGRREGLGTLERRLTRP